MQSRRVRCPICKTMQSDYFCSDCGFPLVNLIGVKKRKTHQIDTYRDEALFICLKNHVANARRNGAAIIDVNKDMFVSEDDDIEFRGDGNIISLKLIKKLKEIISDSGLIADEDIESAKHVISLGHRTLFGKNLSRYKHLENRRLEDMKEENALPISERRKKELLKLYTDVEVNGVRFRYVSEHGKHVYRHLRDLTDENIEVIHKRLDNNIKYLKKEKELKTEV